MKFNLNNYDIYHYHTKGIRIKIPVGIFLPMVMVLNKVIEKRGEGCEAARNLRTFILYRDENLKTFLQTTEEGDILWACSSEELIADIIQTSIDWPQPELTDWVQELKKGKHKF